MLMLTKNIIIRTVPALRLVSKVAGGTRFMHAPSYSADILYWHLRVVFEQERLDIRLAIFGMVAPAALGFHTACRLHVNSTTVVKLYVMLLVVYETESNVATILSPFAAWENGSCV